MQPVRPAELPTVPFRGCTTERLRLAEDSWIYKRSSLTHNFPVRNVVPSHDVQDQAEQNAPLPYSEATPAVWSDFQSFKTVPWIFQTSLNLQVAARARTRELHYQEELLALEPQNTNMPLSSHHKQLEPWQQPGDAAQEEIRRTRRRS
jgi:hypothetical protein